MSSKPERSVRMSSAESRRLPRGEAGVLADTIRLAVDHIGGRKILGAYLLTSEQQSLLDCYIAAAGMPAGAGEACAFAWDAKHVRALNLHATWRPLRETPLHPLEASSSLSFHSPSDGNPAAVRALNAASKHSGHAAVLLRVGAAVSAARQAAIAAAERAAEFDAAAAALSTSADSPAPSAQHLHDASAPPRVVDFFDRSFASLTLGDGFSHLHALGPREEVVEEEKVPLDSMDISLARMRGEAWLDAATAAVAPDGLTHSQAGGAPSGAAGYDSTMVRPCVLHGTRVSLAARVHADLVAAAAERRAAATTALAPRMLEEEGEEGSDDEAPWVVRAAGSLRGALPSRHNLPEQGNWVRLSAAQQVPASLPARAAHRPSAHTTFGSEPRLSSASRRWSYQTALPFTRRGAAPEDASKVPHAAGSFLPLRLAAPGDATSAGQRRASGAAPGAARGAAIASRRGRGPASARRAAPALDLGLDGVPVSVHDEEGGAPVLLAVADSPDYPADRRTAKGAAVAAR